MQDNGEKNDQNKKPDRDEKGRFLKGYSGGPGRGKKTDLSEMSDDDFWNAIELRIREDLMSKDTMTRQRGLKLKIMKDEYLLKKKAEEKAHNPLLVSGEYDQYLKWKKEQESKYSFNIEESKPTDIKR